MEAAQHSDWPDSNADGLGGAGRLITAPMIEARLERIPLLGWHWWALGIVGIAQIAEAIDSLAASFALPVLIQTWSLTPSQGGAMISSMYIGNLIGAALFGWLSDRYGRLNLLRWATLAVVALGMVVASAWSFESFFIFRLFQGLAIGGQLLMSATYLAELSANAFRGRVLFSLNMILGVGTMLAALIASQVVPSFGWQWIFYIAAGISLPFFLLAPFLPESPRWLAARGRVGEAARIVDAIEARVTGSLPEVLPAASQPVRDKMGRWRDLLSPAYLTTTMLLWTMSVSIGFVGVSLLAWLPTILLQNYTLSLKATLTLSSITFSGPLVGSVIGFLIVDRLSRHTALLGGFVGLMASLLVLGVVLKNGAPIALAVLFSFATCVSQVFLLFTLQLFMVELYPTALRGVGAGTARMWLGISAVAGPLTTGAVSGTLGIPLTIALFWMVAAVGFLAAMTLTIHARK